MTRILHFGVVARDGRTTPGLEMALNTSLRFGPFDSLGTSFTETNETFGSPLDPFGKPLGERDALHVIVEVLQDEEDDTVPASADLVRTTGRLLHGMIPSGMRLVDYCIDSMPTWGEDERIHGPWALTSISGRKL